MRSSCLCCGMPAECPIMDACNSVPDSAAVGSCDRDGCLAQAGAGGIQEFDLLTGCKLGGTEGSVQPLCLAYSSDGSRLIGLLQVLLLKQMLRGLPSYTHRPYLVPSQANTDESMQDRCVYAWSLPSWKRRPIVDQPSKLSERDVERPLLALGLVSPGQLALFVLRVTQ